VEAAKGQERKLKIRAKEKAAASKKQPVGRFCVPARMLWQEPWVLRKPFMLTGVSFSAAYQDSG